MPTWPGGRRSADRSWPSGAQETAHDAQARAEAYLGRGREVVEDTSAQLKAAFEAGRGRDAGRDQQAPRP